MKTKHLIITLLISSFFTACSSKNIENKSMLVNNETVSQEIFNSKENWQPINKNSSLQDSINNKEVK